MPILPTGALRALRGHYDGIVAAVCLAAALAALVAGAPPWATIAILAVALLLYHVRSSARERHELGLSQARLDVEMQKLEAIKARHRERLDAPSLLTEPASGRKPAGRARKERP